MRLHIFIITIHFTEFTGTCDVRLQWESGTFMNYEAPSVVVEQQDCHELVFRVASLVTLVLVSFILRFMPALAP